LTYKFSAVAIAIYFNLRCWG